MAAGPNDAQFTGFSKYFNTYTLTGRSNISKVTFGTIALYIVFKKLTSPKKSPASEKK